MDKFAIKLKSHLNFSYFVAQRLIKTADKSFTSVIIKIAIAGLSLSVAIMILSTAIISGFKREINSKIFGFWGHIHISDASTVKNFELSPLVIDRSLINDVLKVKNVEYETNRTIFGIPISSSIIKKTEGGVKNAEPYIITQCLLETKKEMIASLIKGVSKEFDWTRMNKFMLHGRALESNDTSNQIIVSKIIADKLNLKEGSKLIVTFISQEKTKLKRVLKVKGIYNTGLEEYDERFIIGHAPLLQEVLQWSASQYSGLEVTVDQPDEMEVINDYLYGTVLPTNFYSEVIQEKFPNIFEWLKLQDINEVVILILMCVVAIINLITVLLILILERSKMVGIFKSLGASNWSIRKIFLYNTAYILLCGLLIGNLIGLGVAALQKSFGFIKLD
ncbi:MAG: hypothetical protein RLZZ546_40, partial [Bacteroidota bacterium]